MHAVDNSTFVVYICKQKMIGRIKQIMSLEQLSSSQFADSIKLQRSSLSHVLSGRNKPSLDFVMKIKQAYNRISLEWLIFGKGEMFMDHDTPLSSKAADDGIIGDQPMISFNAEENEMDVVKEVTDRLGDEPTPYYGTKRKRIIILNGDGTYEEFTK